MGMTTQLTGSHNRPIRPIQLRPPDPTAHDAKLAPEKKHLRFRVVDSQPHINQIEEQPKQGVHESEHHWRSKSYRAGDPSPSRPARR